MPSLNHLVAYRKRQAEDEEAPESPAVEEAEVVAEAEPEEPEPKPAKPISKRRAARKLSRLPSATAPASRAALVRRLRSARLSAAARRRRTLVLLCVVTVLLGGFAFWAARQADSLRGGAAARNTALTDATQTSELKGKVVQEVSTLFSYDYTDPTRGDEAAKTMLTGKAVGQYAQLIAAVKQQGPVQKLVLTTTATASAVELLQHGRARVLIFADQRNTRATTKDTTYAAAMLAVDVVDHHGSWIIDNLDTLT
jgi:Mce-associated membrane protein